jgi:L-amino acid N-acyltransferase YncA
MSQNNSQTIRKASAEDLPQLLKWGEKLYEAEKVYQPLLKYSESNAKARYSKQISDPKFLFLVAEVNKKPVGYLYAHLDQIEYLNTSKPQCEIEAVFINKEARGMGLSKELLEKAITWAKDNNAFEVKAGIFTKNTISRKLFESSGLEESHITYTKSV